MAYPVFQDSLISASVQINGVRFLSIKISTSVWRMPIQCNLVSLKLYMRVTDYPILCMMITRAYNVAGKLVMVLSGYPPGYIQTQVNKKAFNSYAKQDAAMQHGAIGMFIIQEDFPHGGVPDKGLMYQKYFQSKIRPNSIFISEQMARAIMGDEYEKAKTSLLEPKTFPANIWASINKETRKLQSTDVLGYLEGGDLKDQLLVISAHYDHLGRKDSVIYFGADDDGSGTVSLLELAAAFSKAKTAGKGPRRSILFLANSGEEKGLWGSDYYTDPPRLPFEYDHSRSQH